MIAIPHYISPKDYLDIERQSPIRHEYRFGLVYAMAGSTDNHDRIAFSSTWNVAVVYPRTPGKRLFMNQVNRSA